MKLKTRNLIQGHLLLACVSAQGQTAPPTAEIDGSWPAVFAGRELAATLEDYAVYASAPEPARELREWVDGQLAEIQSRHTALRIPHGIVAAIEAPCRMFGAIAQMPPAAAFGVAAGCGLTPSFRSKRRDSHARSL